MPRSRPGTRTCTACGLTPTVRADGVCQYCTNAAKTDTLRKRPCEVCGEPTVSKVGTHPMCRSLVEEVDVNDPDLALPDGNWRFDPFRRVQIWVPDTPKAPSQDEDPLDPAETFRSFAEAAKQFPCDHCGAKPGKDCMTAQGRPYARGSHRPRRDAVAAVMVAKGRPVERKYKTGRNNPLPEVHGRQFTDDECRDGHARYRQGERDPLTVAQQREYDRLATIARRERRRRDATESASSRSREAA